MPKVLLNKRELKPIDWLWAVILERKASKKLTTKELAGIAKVSYGTMRNYITRSPWDWPRPMRERVCEEFGIKLNVTPNGTEMEVGVG